MLHSTLHDEIYSLYSERAEGAQRPEVYPRAQNPVGASRAPWACVSYCGQLPGSEPRFRRPQNCGPVDLRTLQAVPSMTLSKILEILQTKTSIQQTIGTVLHSFSFATTEKHSPLTRSGLSTSVNILALEVTRSYSKRSVDVLVDSFRFSPAHDILDEHVVKIKSAQVLRSHGRRFFRLSFLMVRAGRYSTLYFANDIP